MDWYKRYIGDYQRDTAEESLTQRGAYDSLLDEYYRREGPLPEDKKLLFRITRSVERWEIEAVDYVLAKFFTLTARGYEHKRCEEVIAQYKKAAEKYLANLAGANVSKAHRQSAVQSAVQSATENPDTRNQINTKPKTKYIRAKPARFVLPEWINPQTWEDFEEMRSRIRAPLTDRARASIVARLSEIRGRPGNDPETVLLRSIERGWRGVFPIKEGGRNGAGKSNHLERTERTLREARAMLEGPSSGTDEMRRTLPTGAD